MVQKKKSKKDEYKDLSPVEGNLLEYPFFAPAYAQHRTVPVIFEAKIDDKRSIVLSSGYGVPDSLSSDIFLYLMWKAKQEGLEVGKKYHFTLTEISKALGYTNKQHLKRSLKALSTTIFEFKSYYSNGVYSRISDFKLIKELSLWESYRGEIPKSKAYEVNYYILDPRIIKQIEKDRYYRLVDFKLHKELKSGISKRLHLFLIKKLGEQKEFKIGFRKLCLYVPIEKYAKYGKIKPALNTLIKALNELKDKGIIHFYPTNKEEILRIIRSKGDCIFTFKPAPAKLSEIESKERVKKLLHIFLEKLLIPENFVSEILKDQENYEKVVKILIYLDTQRGIENKTGFFLKKFFEDENFDLPTATQKEYMKEVKVKINLMTRSLFEEMPKDEILDKFKSEFPYLQDGTILFYFVLDKWLDMRKYQRRTQE